MDRKKPLTAFKDEKTEELTKKATHQTLALWAIACAERAMHYFENNYPLDSRPKQALETLQKWVDTGVFRMSEIRSASLSAHAAAREVGEDSPAKSAARAAGQAVATAHVRTHAIGAAIYAQQAIYRFANENEADAAVAQERDWQYNCLHKLIKNDKKKD